MPAAASYAAAQDIDEGEVPDLHRPQVSSRGGLADPGYSSPLGTRSCEVVLEGEGGGQAGDNTGGDEHYCGKCYSLGGDCSRD